EKGEAFTPVGDTYLLGPGGLADLNPQLREAEARVREAPTVDRWERQYGTLLYRVGRFGGAVRHLERAAQLDKDGGTAWDWLFLAMAHQRLGHAADARRCYDRARARTTFYDY